MYIHSITKTFHTKQKNFCYIHMYVWEYRSCHVLYGCYIGNEVNIKRKVDNLFFRLTSISL